MKPKSITCALAALALSCASVWANTPAEWDPNVPAPSDRLRMDAVSQCVALPENEPVNEGYAAYFTIDSGSPVQSLTAQGLPDGVSIDATTYSLKGAPTKPGIYYAVITAVNMNKFEFSLVLKFNVGEVEEPEYVDELYLSETFQGMTVGSALHYMVGMSSSGKSSYDGDSYSYTSTFSISGLPTGIKTTTKKHSFQNYTETIHFANGVATAAGRYLVSAKSTYKQVVTSKGKTTTDSWDESSQVEVIVNGAESKYYTVQVGKGDGTVTGGGCVVAAGKTFNTTATPAKNSVFAGWYADADCTIAADNSYQSQILDKDGNHGIAAQTWLNGYIHDYNGEPPYSYAPTAPNTLYARFVEKAADTNITVEVGGVAVNDDSYEIIVDNYNFSWPIDAYSTVAEVVDEKVVFKPGSYTSVTAVKGLPKALYAYVANGEVVGIARDSDFALVPGKYPVAITAKNLSGTTVTKTITLVVQNDDGFAFTWGGHGDAWNEKSVTLTLHIGDELTETTGFGITHNYADRIVVSGQPTGLRFSNGVLVGKPTKAGTYTLVAKATSGASGGTMQANVTIVVRDDLTLTVPDADVKYSPIDGVFYLDGLVAVISDSEATLAFKGLPSGVTYDAKNNALKGTAKVEGPATVTVTAKNKSGVTDSADFTLVVPNTKPMVTVVAVYGDESEASDKVTGAGSYAPGKKVTITAKPNKGNFFASWSVIGLVEGEYTINGTTLTFTMPDDPALLESGILVKARFATPQDDVLSIDPLPAYADLLTGDGVVSAFLTNYCASAISPLKIAVSGLPAGLKYNAKTFEVTGTSSKPGSYTVKVTASNSSTSAIVAWILNVPNSDAFGPTFAGTPAPIKLNQAVPFEHVFSLAAGYEGYSVAVAGLPAGLKFDKNSGTVSGRPTKAGTYTVTLTATKKGAATQVAVLTFVVDPLPEWLVGTFTGYSIGVDYDPDSIPDAYIPEDYYNDLVSVTIAKDGKLSRACRYIDGVWKTKMDGNNYTYAKLASTKVVSAKGASNVEISSIDGDGNYVYEFLFDGVPSKVVVSPVVYDAESGVKYGKIVCKDNGRQVEDDWEEIDVLTQNLYERKPAVEGLFSYVGTKTIEFEDYEATKDIPGTLTLKFGKNGAVAATFKTEYNGKAITRPVVAQPVSVEGKVYVYFVSAKYNDANFDMEIKGALALDVDEEGNVTNIEELPQFKVE